MKKYLYIYQSEVMTNLQYVFDIMVGFIGYVIMIFILLNLWKYIYSNPEELIHGYSMNQMMWYIIVTEILWMSLSGRSLCKKISDDVRSGNIAYNLNKPYNYVEYSLFHHLGGTTIRFSLITIVGMVLGIISLHIFPSLNVFHILGVILSCILSIIISSLFIISIGLISFFIEDANPIYWVYSKIILVLGTIFPIEFFPNYLQGFLKYSPIYVVSYGPAKLFVDFNSIAFIEVIVAQVIYIGISLLICHAIYRKGVRKLNVNGG